MHPRLHQQLQLQPLSHRATCSRSAGLTLVELLVTLAVAAVLLGMALPAMDDFLDQRRQTARINDFLRAVNYARSEAAKFGGPVSIQAVDASDDENEWGPGYCVVQGDPGDCDAPVLRMFQGIDDATLDATGGLDDVETLTFNSRGLLTLAAGGSLQLCSDDEDEDPGREMTLNLIGQANTENLTCHP